MVILYDEPAEMGALGAMLCDVQAADIAIQALRATDFYLPKHRTLFVLFSELFERDGRVDLLIAQTEIQRRDLDRQIGEGYAGRLIEAVPSAASIEMYIKALKQASQQRGMKDLLTKTQSMPAGQALDEIERGAAALRERETEDVQAQPVHELQTVFENAISGKRYAVPLPWSALSRDTRALMPGTVTIICGSPGATKSFALIQALRFWVIDCNLKASAFEFEDGTAYHLRRALAQHAGNGRLTDDEWCKRNAEAALAANNTYSSVLSTIARALDAPQHGKRGTDAMLLDWMRRKAKAGCRVLAIDPITAMERGKNPWETDERFIWGAKAILEQYQISLVLVSHPRKMPQGYNQKQVGMDDLAGGSCYARFAQCILCLRAHKLESVTVAVEGVDRMHGGESVQQVESNRTWLCFKSRNGCAEGKEYASFFDTETLSLHELGKKVE